MKEFVSLFFNHSLDLKPLNRYNIGRFDLELLRENGLMMVLPFLLVAIALGLVYFEKPGAGYVVWGGGVLWTLWLLNVHATDKLNLNF